MDLNGIRSVTDIAASPGVSEPTEELGKTQFLELMIAQFNNQDPLDPAKNEDFIAQLAQFSSLEGIQNLNVSMESVAAAVRSSLTLEAASIVGRSVLVPTSRAFVGDGGLGGNILNSQGGSDIRVDILDASGAPVRQLELGPQEQGDVRFLWDGTNAAGDPMPAGSYGVRAYAMGLGDPVQLDVELPELVVSVSLSDQGAVVNLAGGETVPLSDIKEIQ